VVRQVDGLILQVDPLPVAQLPRAAAIA